MNFQLAFRQVKKKMFTIAFTRERSNPKEKSPAIKKKNVSRKSTHQKNVGVIQMRGNKKKRNE